MKLIIFKCFKTRENSYVYDRQTNSVVKITPEEYNELQMVEREELAEDQSAAISKYQRYGFLMPSTLKEICHPQTHNMPHFLENRLFQLILQVTQRCNLRCAYCVYSGKYINRLHNTADMDFTTAREAIDMHLAKSGESPYINLSFYGGEPLLNFGLIQKCVEYIKNSCDKEIRFGITTNGTLFSDKIIDFLCQNNFDILISLDGSKEEHDMNRKFKNGKGSFDVIIKNILRIKECYPEFYNKKLRFNTVVNAKSDFQCTEDFFLSSEIFDDDQIMFNQVNSTNLNDATFLDFEDKFWTKRNFEYLKLLLALLHKIDIKSVSPLVVRNKDEIEKFYKAIRKQTALPEKFHHGGPCLPGIRRLFVTVDGRFFPCERVSEKADFMCIGSLQEGFDLKQINVILNSGKLTENECMECWDLCDCNICIGQMNTASTNDITKEDKMPACQKSKYITMNKLVEICVLRELGYQFSQEGVLS